MHTVHTKSLHQYDHPEFEIIVDFDTVGTDYLPPLIQHLQNCVAEGEVFKPGTIIQYGYSNIQVSQGDEGYLRLDEPNDKGLPFVFKPGITEALHTGMVQLQFADSYGIDQQELTIPTMQESAFVCSNYNKTSNLVLARLAPTDDNDSGWFIGCLNPDCNHDQIDNLHRVSLYEITSAHRQIKPWLAFPTDTTIILEENNIEVTHNEKILTILPDSPLAENISSQQT